MPATGTIFRTVTNTMGDISQEVAKEAKRSSRTTFKDVNKVPEEIKEMPAEQRADATSQFLEEPKVQEFTHARQEDISKENNKAWGQIEQTQQKIDSEIDEDKYAKLIELKQQLYIKANDLSIEKRNTENLAKAKEEKGTSYYDSANDVLSDRLGQGTVFSSAEGRARAIYTDVSSKMYEIKEALRTKKAGFTQDTETAREVVRYLKDGQIKNKANTAKIQKLAKQWETAANTLKTLRNRAGGQINKLEDWVLPQTHDARKIVKAGADAWKKSIIGKLDIDRIEGEQGGVIDDILDSAFINITARRVETTSQQGGSKLTDKGRSSRILHFKTGDDIINYNDEFGNPDIFATMEDHLNSQSRDIALMQIMGSNPQASFDKIKELARADGMGAVEEGLLDTLWRVRSGQADATNVVNDLDYKVAVVSGGFRSILVASKLGSAAVASLADLGSIVLGSGYRGLNSVNIMGKGLETMLQDITSVGKVGKNIELANRIGVVSEFASASIANSRFAESAGAGAAQETAEKVIRMSGLSAFTNANRSAFGLELSSAISNQFDTAFDNLPFKKMFEEYGFTSKDWDVIRATKKRDVKGSTFLDTDQVHQVDDNLGYRLSEMMSNEMNAFIVMPTDRVRKWTTGGKAKGTLSGEAVRSATLFKSFPVAITMMHLNRVAQIEGTAGKAAYAGKMLGTSLIMGTMTLWAYDVATGKTPRDPMRFSMIGEALTKSGGLGIFGDMFIGAVETKYGHSFSDMLVGVPASTMSDMIKSAQDLMHKDADEALGNIYKRAASYIPGQNLWYTRAVVERTVGDFFGNLLDPKHNKKIKNRKRAMRLRNQELLFDN